MYKKVIFTMVLFAFIGIQIVTSLQCYACNTPITCRAPFVETCNNVRANATSRALREIHYNVPNVTSTSFECINIAWNYINASGDPSMIIGCAYSNVHTCKLQLKHQLQRSCMSCNTNLCNKNPAGTFSSSIFTILASVVGLMLVKIWASNL